jgi:nicotinamide-nucleotide amidase
MTQIDDLGERLARALDERPLTVAVAESLTGGSLSAAVARVRGSGDWYRGAIVAYGTRAKQQLLDVSTETVVSESAARAMAEAVAVRLDARLTVAVTGVAGPAQQDGEPPGTVWMATHCDGDIEALLLQLQGSPDAIVEQTCAGALRRLIEVAESTGVP